MAWGACYWLAFFKFTAGLITTATHLIYFFVGLNQTLLSDKYSIKHRLKGQIGVIWAMETLGKIDFINLTNSLKPFRK